MHAQACKFLRVKNVIPNALKSEMPWEKGIMINQDLVCIDQTGHIVLRKDMYDYQLLPSEGAFSW